MLILLDGAEERAFRSFMSFPWMALFITVVSAVVHIFYTDRLIIYENTFLTTFIFPLLQ